MEKTTWIKTDDFQYVRYIAENQWELLEARYAEDKYLICRSIIDLDLYIKNGLEEIKDTINSYYGSIQEFEEAYENTDEQTKNQILAEMIFEDTPYYETEWFILETEDENVVAAKLEELCKN